MKIKNKSAQAWGMDLMIGVIIFSIGIIVFFIYSINAPGEQKENFQELSYQGNLIAKTILSEGYPLDWNDINAVKIGILSGDKINQTKLERFYDLSQSNYYKTKTLFNTKYDYYFFFDKNMTINSVEVDGIGKPGITRDNINASNLIKITRVVVYEDKPTTAYLYVFE
ncbi:MAG: hypothetical protein WC438_04805 [Candidatus Pacearchaeota archaeon]